MYQIPKLKKYVVDFAQLRIVFGVVYGMLGMLLALWYLQTGFLFNDLGLFENWGIFPWQPYGEHDDTPSGSSLMQSETYRVHTS